MSDSQSPSPTPDHLGGSSRPTQKTIALHAGVTAATVSLALRNSPLLSDETRLRIQQIAEELGYRPNPMVSSLMTYLRTGREPSYQATISFVTNFKTSDEWRESQVFVDWYEGARQRGQELGYVVNHFWLKETGMDQNRASKVLWNRGVKGLIFAPLASSRESIDLDYSEFSSVAIGYTLRNPHFICVSNHHARDMVTVLGTLQKRGYRHVGLAVTRKVLERTDFGWVVGLEMGRHMGVGPEKASVYGLEEWSEEGFRRWYAREKPEVIVGLESDFWEWMQRLGPAIPESLGLVHLNCAHFPHAVSGIDQNNFLAGITALELVVAQIQRNQRGVPSHPQVVMIEGKWVEGVTVRPPAAAV